MNNAFSNIYFYIVIQYVMPLFPRKGEPRQTGGVSVCQVDCESTNNYWMVRKKTTRSQKYSRRIPLTTQSHLCWSNNRGWIFISVCYIIVDV